jgi:radical SAM protein with 4Fe4S-binding SPASM domain
MQSFEITTQIGCSVNCTKYCPQEIISTKYMGERILHLDIFKQLTSTIPLNVLIVFSGVSEPFQNQECADMILHAHNKGHKIRIFTTLTGLKLYDAIRLRVVPFERFTLHLPDAEGNAKIPLTQTYYETLGEILTHTNNISFMNMGNSFISFGHENVFRGNPPKLKSYHPHCSCLETPNFIMQPNGDVYFCCQTKGLVEKVGSLYENTYRELIDPNKFKRQSKRMQKDPSSICRVCYFSQPYWLYKLKDIKQKVFGEKLMFDILSGN